MADRRQAGGGLNFRLVINQPDKVVIEKWRSRLDSFGIIIDAQNDRSIDAHGAQTKIEEALDAKIESKGDEARIVSGPNIRLGPSHVTVNAYIPRKPKFF